MRADDPLPRIAQLRALGMSSQTIVARMSLEGWSTIDILDALRMRGASAPRAADIESAHVPSSVPAAPLPAEKESLPREVSRKRESKQSATKIPLISRHIVAASVIASLGVISFSAYTYYMAPIAYSISVASAETSLAPSAIGPMPQLSNEGAYTAAKAAFVAQKKSFIDANLSSMQVSVYKSGQLALQVPIVAKAQQGTWWDTPAGIYTIEMKELDHISTFGGVRMPWSLNFDGNFFIHGWPQNSDGTPVSTDYTGGGIRLTSDDAFRVYQLAETGMTVMVYATTDGSDPHEYSVRGPRLSAKEYLVADLRDGTVLAQSDATSTVPIASVTKLMTALIVIENFNLDKKITITPDMITNTTIQRLRSGQTVTVHDLLILMLTESSNEAAETFARAYGRDAFMSLMNKKAAALGLGNTHYGDPSGLSPDNVSTPHDLYTLLKYIYDNRKFVYEVTSNSLEHDAYGSVVFKGLENFNFIKGVSNPFIGGKIGNTDEAHETYAGVFALTVAKEARPIVVVTLGSVNVQQDVAALLRYINTTYGDH